MEEHTAANKRRSAVLLACFLGLVAAIACAFVVVLGGGLVGLALAFVTSAAVAGIAYWKSDALALAMSRARPADPVAHARLHNLMEGLCVAGGLSKPRVYVIEDDAPNALAVGRDPKHAAVAVTTGLLAKMSRVELEGVLAHELSHVKNYDILLSTLAVAIIGVPLALLRPIADRLLELVVGSRRETLADITGVSLTRYPPGLASALEKMWEDQTVVQSAPRAMAHLWLESPAPKTDGDRRLDTHPPLDERIQALREL